MFADLPVPYGAAFVALLAAWAAAYIAGMALGKPNPDRSRRLALPARLAMIGLTLACGVLWLSLAASAPAGRFAALIMLGLAAGAVGDLLLANLFPIRRPEMAGMAAFGVGHIFYLAAMLSLRATLGAEGAGPVLIAATLGIIGGAAGWALLVRNPTGSSTLNTGSLIYGALLTMATAVAAGLAIETGRLAILALGLGLFTASDFLLAQYLVRQRTFPHIRDVVWIVYSAGQMLIAFSIGAALVAAV